MKKAKFASMLAVAGGLALATTACGGAKEAASDAVEDTADAVTDGACAAACAAACGAAEGACAAACGAAEGACAAACGAAEGACAAKNRIIRFSKFEVRRLAVGNYRQLFYWNSECPQKQNQCLP